MRCEAALLTAPSPDFTDPTSRLITPTAQVTDTVVRYAVRGGC
jgi:hypothetical protein